MRHLVIFLQIVLRRNKVFGIVFGNWELQQKYVIQAL